ncbi:hypothetical protein BGZ98_008736 [Dissophora globulifera]|nr:hypothetical protein BGZ98_008736 [Dissophora globulifera]
MRLIISVLLATAALCAVATADVHQGQQAAFRLEPRHNHNHNHHQNHRLRKANINPHHKSISSKKQRRSLRAEYLTSVIDAERADPEDNFQLRSKKTCGHSKKDKHSHNHHQQSKRALKLHRKNASKKSKKSSTFSDKLNKRRLERMELHHKKKATKGGKGRSAYEKIQHIQRRALASDRTDAELEFHRKISRHRKTKLLGQSKKNKRELFKTQEIKLKKKLSSKVDKELAFHNRIYRNRKTRLLGHKRQLIEMEDIELKTRSIGKTDTELQAFHRKISHHRKAKLLGKSKKSKRQFIETQDIKPKKKCPRKQQNKQCKN